MPAYADLFTHDRSFTVGVEEEYMLCHPTTGDLISRADSILARLDEDERERFSYELILSEIADKNSEGDKYLKWYPEMNPRFI